MGDIMSEEKDIKFYDLKVYNTFYISDEKFEEYINSNEWIELDDLFKKVAYSEGNAYVSPLIETIAYGEIVRVKFDDFMSNVEGIDDFSTIFPFIPTLMDMPFELATNVIEEWECEVQEKRKKAFETVLDYIKDHQIEELIENIKIGIDNNDYKSIENTFDELYEIGEYALPRLKLIILNQELPLKFLSGINQMIVHISIKDFKKAEDLSNRLFNENEDIFNPAFDELRKIIKEIDLEPYFARHPEKL